MIVRISLIKLQHRELRIVLRRDPLIAEVPVNLVDTIHPANYQPLEIQLGRDAQEQIQIERIVMGRERLRRRAAGDWLHHRRLDLEIATLVKELP